MQNKFLAGVGLALCVAVTIATYWGTRSVLADLRDRDSGRSAEIERLVDRLSTLERRDRFLDLRLRGLTTRQAPAQTAQAAPTAEGTAVPPGAEPALALIPRAGNYPGAVITDPSWLTPQEREYLEKYPPPKRTVLVRGTEGQLGHLFIASIREGTPTVAELTDETLRSIEDLAMAIVDLDGVRKEAMVDLAALGAGEERGTMEEAVDLGNSLGGYYVHPVEDRYRVFPAKEINADPRVASVAEFIEEVKQDFGESTSYVVQWVQPALQ